MTRGEIRELKRAIHTAIAANATEQDAERARISALALLEHSVVCGHKRLTILRLAAAIQLGANVTPKQWKYCYGIISQCADNELQNIFISARHDRHESKAHDESIFNVRC